MPRAMSRLPITTASAATSRPSRRRARSTSARQLPVCRATRRTTRSAQALLLASRPYPGPWAHALGGRKAPAHVQLSPRTGIVGCPASTSSQPRSGRLHAESATIPSAISTPAIRPQLTAPRCADAPPVTPAGYHCAQRSARSRCRAHRHESFAVQCPHHAQPAPAGLPDRANIYDASSNTNPSLILQLHRSWELLNMKASHFYEGSLSLNKSVEAKLVSISVIH